MDRRFVTVVVAAVLALGMTGCKPKAPQGDPETERRALAERAETYKRDAVQTLTLTPARKTELQQLASDVRAWQKRTNRNDLHVTEDSVTAQRINDSGGGGGCEDCPGYRVDGDRICFLEHEGECPADDGSDLQIGRVCVYTCIWIGSEVEPMRKGG